MMIREMEKMSEGLRQEEEDSNLPHLTQTTKKKLSPLWTTQNQTRNSGDDRSLVSNTSSKRLYEDLVEEVNEGDMFICLSSSHEHHLPYITIMSVDEEEEVAVTNTGKTIPFHVLKEGQYYQRIFISNPPPPPSDFSSPGTNQQQQQPLLPNSQRHHEVSSDGRERYMGEGAKEGFFLRYKQLVTSSTHLPTSSNLPPLSLPSSSLTPSNSSESPLYPVFVS